MKITTCKDCPNTFTQPNNGHRQLCDACRQKRIRKRARDYSHLHPVSGAEKRRRKKAAAAAPTADVSIAEFNRMAREQHLSYGQLAAMLRNS